MKASSAGVSLGLLGNLWARDSPDGQGEGAGAHVGCIVGEAGLEAVLLPGNCCCIIPPESVKLDGGSRLPFWDARRKADLRHVVRQTSDEM